MFDSTVELITPVASNSLMAFCFCNLIILLLLLSGWKPDSPADQDGGVCAKSHLVTERIEKEKKRGYEASSLDDIEAISTNISKTSDADKVAVDDDVVIVNSDEDDDELRRRVEEFIDKVNRGWRAEMLRTSPYLERGVARASQ